MSVYIFFIAAEAGELWYPLQLSSDASAIANAKFNERVVRVENLDGVVLWSKTIQ